MSGNPKGIYKVLKKCFIKLLEISMNIYIIKLLSTYYIRNATDVAVRKFSSDLIDIRN